MTGLHLSARVRTRVRTGLTLATLGAGCADAPAALDPAEAATLDVVARAARVDDGDSDSASAGGSLLELHHESVVDALARTDSRIVSHDAGRWILWDRKSGRPIARGEAPFSSVRVDVAGDTLLNFASNAIELRSAQDGSLHSSIALPARPVEGALTPDGHHVYVADASTLRAWDTAGVLRITHPAGGLFFPRILASVEALYIAPANAKRVELVSLASGAVRASEGAYLGDFHRWFLDGGHFITSVPGPAPLGQATLHVYATDGKLVQSVPWKDALRPAPTAQGVAGGDRAHFWVTSAEGSPARDVTRVYRIGTAAPVLTFEGTPVAVYNRTALYPFTTRDFSLRLLDLRGDVPVTRDLPFDGGAPVRALATSDTDWIFENRGVVFDGARLDPRGRASALGHGYLSAIAGAPDTLAVSTSDRITRIYTVRTGAPALRATIEGIHALESELSADGRLLLLRGAKDGETGYTSLYAYAIDADGKPTPRPLPPQATGAMYVSLGLSANGARLARTECGEITAQMTPCITRVFEDGRQLFETPRVGAPVSRRWAFISPSGKRVATVSYRQINVETVANVYEDGALKTTLANTRALLWLDEERLLASQRPPFRDVILDVSGKQLATLERPLVGEARSAGPGRFHDQNGVFSAVDGKLLWSVPSDGATRPSYAPSAVAGDYFVYTRAEAVRFAKLPAAPQ